MKIGKKNEIKINPLAYNLMIIGESGIGKTTVVNEYCKKLVGEIDDSYLFVECGKEDGGSAINGIPYVTAHNWDDDYDEELNTVGVRTLVDDIIYNKATDWKDLKVVVFDTLDELFAIAEPRVIEMHNNENPKKRVKSIKGAFGGFQAGEDKTVEIVQELLWDLKKVGVSFIVIGHTKSRTQTDVETGQEYQQLTTNMPNKYFNAIKTKVHFLGVASIDREIVREKTGKKDFVTKEDIKKGVIKNETRKITFRDNNYNIDSKSRFSDIVPSIPLDSDELIKAITDAIKVEYAKSGNSIDGAIINQAKEEKEFAKRVAEQEAKNHSQKEIEEIKSQIIEFFTNNKTNMAVIKPILEKCKELNYANPKEISDVEDAKAILAMTLQ